MDSTHCWCVTNTYLHVKTRSYCDDKEKINQIFPSFSVIMEWALHPIVMAMATEKMGIMETGGGVHIVLPL